MNRPLNYQMYRTNAAFRMTIIYPQTREGDTFPDPGGYMFMFAKKIEGSQRNYDWQNPVKFMLGAGEVGGFIEALESGADYKIYHDPDRGRENEGSRAKTLELKISGDKRFPNISTSDVRLGFNITRADEVQMKTLMSSTLGLCYGW